MNDSAKAADGKNVSCSQTDVWISSTGLCSMKSPKRSITEKTMLESGFKNTTMIQNIAEISFSNYEKLFSEKDILGCTHTRYQQFYDGIKVIGGELVEHRNPDGSIYLINGKIIEDENFSTEPRISLEDVVSVIEQSSEEITVLMHDIEPRLVIAGGTLCYEINAVMQDGSGEFVSIHASAHNGEIVGIIKMTSGAEEVFETSSISGNCLEGEGGGTVIFNATRSFWVEYTSGGYGDYIIPGSESYSLRSIGPDYRKWQIRTSNQLRYDDLYLGRPASYYEDYVEYLTAGTIFTSTNGNFDEDKISAAYNISRVMDYNYSILGRKSFNHTNSKSGIVPKYATAVLFVDHEGVRKKSACYEAFSSYNYKYYKLPPGTFLFGAGDGSTRTDQVALDIIAHEFGHAIINFTSQLVDYSVAGNPKMGCEPNALNESYADIFSLMVENYYQPDGTGCPDRIAGHFDWYIGEDSCTESGNPYRNIRNPVEDNGYAMFYEGINWDTQNSYSMGTVQTYAFYLLSEGGTGYNYGVPEGVSPVFYSVNGLGVQTAGRIAMRACIYYCTPHSCFIDSARGWILAACEYYRAGLIDLNGFFSVADAWAAVGCCPAFEINTSGGEFGINFL